MTQEQTRDPLVQVRNLHKDFGSTHAVNGVNLEIYTGEMVGLVGESGSGKTTLGQTILQMQKPTSGEVFYKGTNLATLKRKQMRALRTDIQYIFQDPYGSLNPRLTIEEAIGEPLLAHGLATKENVRELVQEALVMCDMPLEAVDRYPHEFSGGQRQRIVIARAMALNPDFVVADEPVSALDVSIQAQIINLFADLRDSGTTSFLFISHDLSVVEHLCDRILIMYKGSIVEQGTTEQIFSNPQHPYTRALLAAVPIPDPRRRKRHAHVGEWALSFNTDKPMIDIGEGHLVMPS